MRTRNIWLVSLLATGLAASCGVAFGQEADPRPPMPGPRN